MHARRKDSMEYEGLLTDSQGEGPQLHRLARLLGYVCTAFLVACANASLVRILSGARQSFPAYRSLAGSPNTGVWFPSQVVLVIPSSTLRQAHPRAPPIPPGVPSWNLAGNTSPTRLAEAIMIWMGLY